MTHLGEGPLDGLPFEGMKYERVSCFFVSKMRETGRMPVCFVLFD